MQVWTVFKTPAESDDDVFIGACFTEAGARALAEQVAKEDDGDGFRWGNGHVANQRTEEPHILMEWDADDFSADLPSYQIALTELHGAPDPGLLIEAIDSHIYWQLSDEVYRNNGEVSDPGSDDEATAKTIERYREIQDALELAK